FVNLGLFGAPAVRSYLVDRPDVVVRVRLDRKRNRALDRIAGQRIERLWPVSAMTKRDASYTVSHGYPLELKNGCKTCANRQPARHASWHESCRAAGAWSARRPGSYREMLIRADVKC